MNHILAAGSFMEMINILSHHGQFRHLLGELSDSHMSTTWSPLINLAPTPLVLSPTETQVVFESFAEAGWAGSKRSHSPVSASLKVGNPLSADAPASVVLSFP